MSTKFHAYAASAPQAPLEPLNFDPGALAPEEVEIQVSHCGVCHSDLSMLDNEWGMSQFPFVPGHEAVGRIVALGEHAKGLNIGQRVARDYQHVGQLVEARISFCSALAIF